MNRSMRWRRAAALSMAAGLVVAACGGNDSESSSSGSSSSKSSSSSAASSSTKSGPYPAETAPPFRIDAAGCPADATTALAPGEPIKVAMSLPQSGPVASFGVIPQGVKVVFDKVNEAGGIGGHKIELISADDAYDAGRTKTNVEKFLGGDKVMATLFQVGTPNVVAVRQLYEDTCTPQMWVGTGFPAFGDPKNFPFTSIGLLAYSTEAQLWAEWIKDEYPDGAKVAQLVYNNDFGKAYAAAFEKAVAGTNIKIVDTKLHDPNSNLKNEVTALVAAGPDVILGETTVQFCTGLFNEARAAGFDGPIMLSLTCASIEQFWKPAGEAAENGYILSAQKDPSDDQYDDDEAMKTYRADVAKYNSGLDADNGSVATGYNLAHLFIENARQALEMEGGLTRVNLANAMWNTNAAMPLSLRSGKVLTNGNVDAYGAEATEVLKWDPDKGSLVPTGKVYDKEGETGLWGG